MAAIAKQGLSMKFRLGASSVILCYILTMVLSSFAFAGSPTTVIEPSKQYESGNVNAVDNSLPKELAPANKGWGGRLIDFGGNLIDKAKDGLDWIYNNVFQPIGEWISNPGQFWADFKLGWASAPWWLKGLVIVGAIAAVALTAYVAWIYVVPALASAWTVASPYIWHSVLFFLKKKVIVDAVGSLTLTALADYAADGQIEIKTLLIGTIVGVLLLSGGLFLMTLLAAHFGHLTFLVGLVYKFAFLVTIKDWLKALFTPAKVFAPASAPGSSGKDENSSNEEDE